MEKGKNLFVPLIKIKKKKKKKKKKGYKSLVTIGRKVYLGLLARGGFCILLPFSD